MIGCSSTKMGKSVQVQVQGLEVEAQVEQLYCKSK